jgi:hypothetical protein
MVLCAERSENSVAVGNLGRFCPIYLRLYNQGSDNGNVPLFYEDSTYDETDKCLTELQEK